MSKLVDPMETVRRATGRRAQLSTILKLNTRTSKCGLGCDAPRWWCEGRLAQLAQYCAQDVRALADLVTRAEIRLPGMTVTRDASVVSELVRREPSDGGAASGADSAGASSSMMAQGGTGKRQRQEGATSETTARKSARVEPRAADDACTSATATDAAGGARCGTKRRATATAHDVQRHARRARHAVHAPGDDAGGGVSATDGSADEHGDDSGSSNDSREKRHSKMRRTTMFGSERYLVSISMN